MSFNFPNSPLEGQLYTPVGGYQYIWLDGKWRVVEAPQSVGTAQSRNRLVNGAMQFSEEWSFAAGTGNYYAADQWTTFLGPANTGVITSQVVSPTPMGAASYSRYRCTVTTANPTLAANTVYGIFQALEFNLVADFQYGSATAKQAILRFGFKGPAGTYSIRIGNWDDNRSYVANFTISAGQANTDTLQVFVIPGDTTGNWLGVAGAWASVSTYVYIIFAASTNYQGVAGWQSGNKYNTAASTNGWASAGAVYEFWDVGLYLDPNNTGIAPKWEVPDFGTELVRCQRYYMYIPFLIAETNALCQSFSLPTTMRTTPTVSAGAPGFGLGYANQYQVSFYAATRQVAHVVFNAR